MACAGGIQERSITAHTVMTTRQHNGGSGNHESNLSGVTKYSSLNQTKAKNNRLVGKRHTKKEHFDIALSCFVFWLGSQGFEPQLPNPEVDSRCPPRTLTSYAVGATVIACPLHRMLCPRVHQVGCQLGCQAGPDQQP